MTGFETLERKARSLREALLKEIEVGQHRPAFVKLLTRSADDAEEIQARMHTGVLLQEDVFEDVFPKPADAQ